MSVSSISIRRRSGLLGLLTNYRLHISRLFFIGAVTGINLYRYGAFSVAKYSGKVGTIQAFTEVGIQHRELFWNQFSGQFALEVGCMIASNFPIKLEFGYNIFGLNIDSIKDLTTNDNEDISELTDVNLNSLYFTLGFGYFFG